MVGEGPLQDARLKVLRSATARRILAYLARQPVRSTRRVAEVLEIDAGPVAYHVHRLEVTGLVAWEGNAGVEFLAASDDALPFLQATYASGSKAYRPIGGHASGGHGRPPRPEFSMVSLLRVRQRPSFCVPGRGP